MSARKHSPITLAPEGYYISSPVKRSMLAAKAERRHSDAFTDTIPASRPGFASPTGRALSPERSSEKVRVVVRCRPAHGEETAGGVALDSSSCQLTLHRGATGSVNFTFDQVLSQNAPQAEVYDTAALDVVDDVLNGFNGTIMAYGQTGAGKTYTLSSTDTEAVGIMPRACLQVFTRIDQHPQEQYTVLMSIVQLYTERIQDLLLPTRIDLAIREGPDGVFVEGVHQARVQSPSDCFDMLRRAERNRAIASTAMNAVSSRSHVVVMLTVIQHGSERLKKSLSTGDRANEAKHINLSLTTLGLCINARADPNQSFVPFRNSKLTRLLQDSLGGNAKTSLVIAVSDALEHVNETLDSLNFGTRAMMVKTKAVVNEVDMASMNLPQHSSDAGGSDDGGKQQNAQSDELLAALRREWEQKTALDESNRHLRERNAELAAERTTVRQLEVELNRYQETARQLEKQLYDGQNALAELSESHDRLEQQTRRVQQETQTLRRDKLSLIKEKQLEQERLEQKAQQEQQEAARAQQQIIGELQMRLEAAESAQQSSASELQAALRSNSSLQAECKQLKASHEAESKQAKASFDQLKTQHSGNSRDVSRLTAANATLIKETQRLERERASMREDIGSLQEMLLQVENERDSLSAERADLEDERNMLLQENEQRTVEKQALQEDNDVLRPQVAQLEEKLAAETAASQRRGLRAENFREQLEATRKALASSQKQLTESNRANEEMRNEMQTWKQENEAACKIQRAMRRRILARLVSQKNRTDQELEAERQDRLQAETAAQDARERSDQQLLQAGMRLMRDAAQQLHNARSEIRQQLLVSKTDLDKRKKADRKIASKCDTPFGTPLARSFTHAAGPMAHGLSASSMSMANLATYGSGMPVTPRMAGAPSTPRGFGATLPRTPRGYDAGMHGTPGGFNNPSMPSTPRGGTYPDQYDDSPRSTESGTPRRMGSSPFMSPHTGLPATPLTAAANSAFAARGPGIGRRPTGEGVRRMSNLGEPSHAESPVH
ncbi:hypothetical protein WJX73_003259 [Symbiochloris irregularis]|uniref:Kinesin motor domain-containing protein n=1 Tax=Symbiochloris irregularis TaxID=706552 RepID=A0AAW1PE02_9CHLO